MAETREQREAERERDKREFTPRKESAEEPTPNVKQTLDQPEKREGKPPQGPGS